MKGYVARLSTIVWKDLVLEMRTKDIGIPILVFAFLTILIFNFAFEPGSVAVAAVAPGVLWVAIAFAAVLGFSRAFAMEKDKGCIEGLMLCPVEREVIYFGKMISSLIFILIAEVIILPLFSVLFNLPVFIPHLVVLAVFTSIGFATLGTILAAMAANTRAREIMLPILFLPVIVPLVIATVNGSQLAIAGAPWEEIFSSLRIVLAFDLIFLVVAPIIFPFVLED
ncbi:MAG: heme exporter protein CcmB [Chloroflexi bacterium]|nr:heme exporter protein CcmB [Chloroflexota bacterium]